MPTLITELSVTAHDVFRLLNPDFRDMLSALCAEDVEFLLVRAYAMAVSRRIDILTSIDGVEFDET